MTVVLIGIICILSIVLLWVLFSHRSRNFPNAPQNNEKDSSAKVNNTPPAVLPQYRRENIYVEPLYNKSTAYPGQTIAEKVVPSWLQDRFATLLKYFTISTKPEKRIITAEFINVADAIKRGEPVILVSGGAGTGKTTLIEWLIEQGLADIVVAFTGAAALNCHGKTIHSLFEIPPKLIDPKMYLSQVKNETVSLICNARIIVIDEISMVRADLMDAIDRRLREIRQNDLSFGGLQLLLVGDPCQLPPVVSEQESVFFRNDRMECLWNSPWFFDAHVFTHCPITHYVLTEVFRQDDAEKEYIKFLNLARRRKKLDKVVEYFNSHCFTTEETNDVVTLTAKNNEAAERNKKELEKLPDEIFTSTAICDGAFQQMVHKKVANAASGNPDTRDDMKKLPAPYQLSLKKGAFVMILVNDAAGRFVNGTTGIVKNIDSEESSIEVQLINGNIVAITKHEWESENIEWDSKSKKIIRYVDGHFTQYPLTLAWAITTHKAQGRTLPKAQIDYSGAAFQPGQMYVALSRTRRIHDLKLLRLLTEQDFPQDVRLNEWIKTLVKQKSKQQRH